MSEPFEEVRGIEDVINVSRRPRTTPPEGSGGAGACVQNETGRDVTPHEAEVAQGYAELALGAATFAAPRPNLRKSPATAKSRPYMHTISGPVGRLPT